MSEIGLMQVRATIMNSPKNIPVRFRLLHPDEIERFDALVEHSMSLQMTIEDCAANWREHLRRIFPDPQQCREAFLRHSVIISARHGIQNDSSPADLPSLALYICARVEQLVREIDAKEENDRRE